MNMRTPLARARGLGSAKEGLSHWWAQRLTALALIPLTLWFVFSLAAHLGQDFAAVTGWISSPLVTVALILYLGALFYHSQLGLEVVVEDYVHTKSLKLAAIIVFKFANIILGTAAIIAVLLVAFGAA